MSAARDNVVSQVLMDSEAELEILDKLVILETLDLLAHQDPQDKEELQDLVGTLVLWDLLALLDNQVLLEQLVIKASLVILERQALTGQQDRQEPKAREVKQDSLELLDSKESQVLTDSQGRLDLRDSQDPMDSPVFQDLLACLDWRVHEDHKDRLVHRVLRVQAGHLAHLVQLETQAAVVHLDRSGLQDNLELEVNKVFVEWLVLMVPQVTEAVTAVEDLVVTEVLMVTLAGLE